MAFAVTSLRQSFLLAPLSGAASNLQEISQQRVPGAGVGKYYRTHGDVGFSRGRATNWASGGGSGSTKLYLSADNAGSGTSAHEEKNKACGIATELQSCANVFEGQHGWGAPGAVK